MLTRELAESVLADFVGSKQPRQITASQSLRSVPDISVSVWKSSSAPADGALLSSHVQIAMYLFRELTDFSYPLSDENSVTGITRL